MCKMVYQMDIQIYQQISILKNCSKVKLCRAISLRLGLKVVKIISWNVAKFGVHDCLSNGHPNLWASFHSKKYVKSQTPSYSLLWFGLKELKITLNIVKVGMHAYHPNVHQKTWSNFNSEKFVKSETLACGFAKVEVKGVENSLERCESWSACLSIKWASKSMIKFPFWEIGQKWSSIVHFH